MEKDIQRKIELPQGLDHTLLMGTNNEVKNLIEDSFDARVTFRGETITLSGAEAELRTLEMLFSDLIERAAAGEQNDCIVARRAINLFRDEVFSPKTLRDDILLTYHGRAIRPKTKGQKHYVDAIRSNIITFAIGPAGTGKTYLAMAMAVAALKRREVGRIILSRPVVEAGENLGFLPGTLNEKIDPYIRPLYDALFDMMDSYQAHQLLEAGTIEIAPLAFMRGRTLNDCFVILDEAQNTTNEQMKMFLTRLGFGSKMVITGDITQIDLPKHTSGLKQAAGILADIDQIAVCEFGKYDVVRHNLVASIISAYDKSERKE